MGMKIALRIIVMRPISKKLVDPRKSEESSGSVYGLVYADENLHER